MSEFSRSSLGARGGTPYDRLYGEAPPERGVFLRSRYKKGYRKMTFFRYFKGSIKRVE